MVDPNPLKFTTDRASGILPSSDVDQNFKNLMRFYGDWESGTYVKNQVVIYQGVIYLASKETSDTPSGTSPDWVVIGIIETGNTWKGYHSNNGITNYEKNWQTMRNGELLIANKATSALPDGASDDWDLQAFIVNLASLGGTCSISGSITTSFKPLENWQFAVAVADFADTENNPNAAVPDKATGIITLPRTAEYEIIANFIGSQSGTEKEFSLIYEIRSSILGDVKIGHESVDTDKTNDRTYCSVFTYQGTAGETLQLGVRRVGGSGFTYTFEPSTFDVKMMIPVEVDNLDPVFRDGP